MDFESRTFQFRGVPFNRTVHNIEVLELLEDFSVQHDDLYIVTFPKSGTTWMQVLVSLIQVEGDNERLGNITSFDRSPWLELHRQKVLEARSPRIISSHLPFFLMPRKLREGAAKVIYVTRDPKDVLVSLFHFFGILAMIPADVSFKFEDVLESFLNGKCTYGDWFDHVRGWLNSGYKNFLHVTYEELSKDLAAVVKRVCKFLDKSLTEEQVQKVMKHSSFEAMRDNPLTNYSKMVDLVDLSKGDFIRKGKVGDWKNHFTVAQSEWFDVVYCERMEGFDPDLTWNRRPSQEKLPVGPSS
uniref:sulfotransferase 2B1-like isoform X1 n=1 Tax=Myxine glutinosa TaxID=7769 RepID=UPI00359019E6